MMKSLRKNVADSEGSNPQPPDHQSDAHPTEPPRPYKIGKTLINYILSNVLLSSISFSGSLYNRSLTVGHQLHVQRIVTWQGHLNCSSSPKRAWTLAIPASLRTAYLASFLVTWPRGYKTFFVLNSAEREILSAQKCENS